MQILSDVGVVEGNETTIIKFMEYTDVGYQGFGEMYFSLVPCGVERCWKIHQKATCNLMVPYGKVLFFIAEYDLSNWSFVELGGAPQKRLTIPPGYWYSFLGLGDHGSIIANVIDIRHKDEKLDVEQKRLSEDVPMAKVVWNDRSFMHEGSCK